MTKKEYKKLCSAWAKQQVALGILYSEEKAELWTGSAYDTRTKRLKLIYKSFCEVHVILDKLLMAHTNKTNKTV